MLLWETEDWRVQKQKWNSQDILNYMNSELMKHDAFSLALQIIK
jgi:hypothetical protein